MNHPVVSHPGLNHPGVSHPGVNHPGVNHPRSNVLLFQYQTLKPHFSDQTKLRHKLSLVGVVLSELVISASNIRVKF